MDPEHRGEPSDHRGDDRAHLDERSGFPGFHGIRPGFCRIDCGERGPRRDNTRVRVGGRDILPGERDVDHDLTRISGIFIGLPTLPACFRMFSFSAGDHSSISMATQCLDRVVFIPLHWTHPMSDFIPAPDGQFDNWQENYFNFADEHINDLGLDRSDIDILNDAKALWQTTYIDQAAAHSAARAATAAKKAAKADYIALLRSYTRQIQANPIVTNALREGLGITVPDTDISPIAPPKSAPTLHVDISQRFHHTIKFYNADNGRGKPAGAASVEIWFRAGEEPAGPDQLTYAGLASGFTYERKFTSANANQPIYYMARWMNAKGEPGPWSEPVRATVAA